MKDFLQAKKEELFDGEFTISKTQCWLTVALVFVLGVLYGLKKAPWTHGVNMTIGSHNGNNNCDCNCDCDCDCEDEEECECIACCEAEEDEKTEK